MPTTFLGNHSGNHTSRFRKTIYRPGQSSRAEVRANAGARAFFTVGGGRFNMRYVPGGFTFPTDFIVNSFRDDTNATVIDSYWIAETAVTYHLWSVVLDWALSHGYTFANPGRPGGYTDDRGNTLRTFGPGHEMEPVTAINWRDAIVWLNALTEYYHQESGADLGCVYLDENGAPIRDSKKNAAACDRIKGTKNHAKGFRLPTSLEWELVARYQDGVDWTPGNHVSGDTTGYCYPTDAGRSKAFINYAWYLGNSNLSGLDIFCTRPVGKKAPNALGVYDLCGNVWEWLFDIEGNSLRMIRGGSWFDDADCMRLGLVCGENPGSTDCNLGFRMVKSGGVNLL
jgi:sulfatase modifying factor 1